MEKAPEEVRELARKYAENLSLGYSLVFRAVEDDNVIALEWLYNNVKKETDWAWRRDAHLPLTAANHGSIKALQWLKMLWEKGKIDLCLAARCSCALRAAALHEQIGILDWLHKNGFTKRETLKDNLNRAASRGKVKTFQWLVDNGAATVSDCETESCLFAAAENSQMGILDLLKEIGAATPRHCKADESYIFRIAADRRNMGMLRWLQINGALSPEDCQSYEAGVILCHAARRREFEFVEWLIHNNATTAERCLELYTKKSWDNGDKFIAIFANASGSLHESQFEEEWDKVFFLQIRWRQKILLLVLAGRRGGKPRLPPELWEWMNDENF